MGIGNHELYFLKYLSRKISFKSVATIGRQFLVTQPDEIKKIVNTNQNYEGYCEVLLKKEFNATSVDSYDFDDYEGADYVFDFNKDLKDNKTYDLVLDFGSMEHIFNIPQVVKNISKLTKINGYIAHANPANNFCGHGLYQFSPEFYYSLYSEKNGFSDTEIFLAEYPDHKKDINYWYKAESLSDGKRKEFLSYYGVGSLVLTKKKMNKDTLDVIQSDYEVIYKNKDNQIKIKKENSNKIKKFLKRFYALRKIASLIGQFKYNLKKKRNTKLRYLKNNKNFKKIDL